MEIPILTLHRAKDARGQTPMRHFGSVGWGPPPSPKSCRIMASWISQFSRASVPTFPVPTFPVSTLPVLTFPVPTFPAPTFPVPTFPMPTFLRSPLCSSASAKLITKGIVLFERCPESIAEGVHLPAVSTLQWTWRWSATGCMILNRKPYSCPS